MGLLQMSFSGGILILVVLILRGFFIHKLPKKTFLALWWVVLLRLLLPVAVPSAFSAYSLVNAGLSAFGWEEVRGDTGILASLLPGAQGVSREDTGILVSFLSGVQDTLHGKKRILTGAERAEGEAGDRQKGRLGLGTVSMQKIQPGQMPDRQFPPQDSLAEGENRNDFTAVTGKKTAEYAASVNSLEAELTKNQFPYRRILGVIYFAGLFCVAAFFAISYLKCRLEFRMSLPVKEPFYAAWLKAHPLKRSVSIRRLDRITAPLTYGIFRPVILLPGKADINDTTQLEYVLLHEYIHIRRLDAVTKLLIILALCLHWFNPLVWAMYLLFNRDLELACDEQVVKRLGMDSRTPYALTLIGMEEKRHSLMPLCNGFGRNAIEERIKAIMKIKKTSLWAMGAAAMLVIAVTALFATTAAADSRQFSAIPGTEYTEAEYRMLLALKFEGYEDMTIAEFREKVFNITDTENYQALLERFTQDVQAEELKDENETAAFLYYCLIPLTAEEWKVRDFEGYSDVKFQDTWERAVLEYSLSLIIWDEDRLKVGDYLEARADIFAELERFMGERSDEELQDKEKMEGLIGAEIEALHHRWDTDSLEIQVKTWFMPGGSAENQSEGMAEPAGYGLDPEAAATDAELQAQALEERQAQYEVLLAPYLPFGLTYFYDRSADRFRLYYQGKEARGLVDEEQGSWITESAGIDSYPKDAMELYAVYENGVLVGLREATAEEQTEYTRMRQENSELRKLYEAGGQDETRIEGEARVRDGADTQDAAHMQDGADTQDAAHMQDGADTQDSAHMQDGTHIQNGTRTQDETRTQGGAEVQGEFRGEPGTAEDYASLLALMAPDYKALSVADFNMSLLEWTNANFEQMERISIDTGWDDFRVSLNEAELAFVKQTIFLSGTENGAYVESAYTGLQEADPVYGRYLPERTLSAEGAAAWCDLYYQCSWHIADKEALTVGQRDASVQAMMQAVEDFWEEADFEELMKLERQDIVAALQEIAARCSNEQIAFTVRKDHVSFEKMDERGLDFD